MMFDKSLVFLLPLLLMSEAKPSKSETPSDLTMKLARELLTLYKQEKDSPHLKRFEKDSCQFANLLNDLLPCALASHKTMI
jgi:hypothetical protein